MPIDKSERILDFAPIGMWWEVTKSTADTNGESFEAINVVPPGFGGPPLHIHPTAEESYEVISGTLDVCVDKTWRRLGPNQSVTIPAGVPHTLRNASAEAVRIINVHRPALAFEHFSGGFTRSSSSAASSFHPEASRRSYFCPCCSLNTTRRSSRLAHPRASCGS